jgi:drug/metabolite transporter (DMT)-like permease
MIVAGVCWGVYSLAGRGSRHPLVDTSRNFLRATILGVLAVGILLAGGRYTTSGVLLAATSGSIASGLGYTLWYTVLPALAAWRAAVVQLLVPVLTALLAAILLAETITPRLLVATALIAGGVWLTVGSRTRTDRRASAGPRTPAGLAGTAAADRRGGRAEARRRGLSHGSDPLPDVRG